MLNRLYTLSSDLFVVSVQTGVRLELVSAMTYGSQSWLPSMDTEVCIIMEVVANSEMFGWQE